MVTDTQSQKSEVLMETKENKNAVYKSEASDKYGPCYVAKIFRDTHTRKDKPVYFYFSIAEHGEAKAKKLAEQCLKDGRAAVERKRTVTEVVDEQCDKTAFPVLNATQQAKLVSFLKTDLAKSYIGITEYGEYLNITVQSPKDMPPVNRVNRTLRVSDFNSLDGAYKCAIELRNYCIIGELNNAEHWIRWKSADADVYMFKGLRVSHYHKYTSVIVTLQNKETVVFNIGKYTKAQATALAVATREKGDRLSSIEVSRVKEICSAHEDLKQVENLLIDMFKTKEVTETVSTTKEATKKEKSEVLSTAAPEKAPSLSVSDVYEIKDVDYEGCNPIIADCLKQGKRIFCTIDKTNTKFAYVIGYSSKKDTPYLVENGTIDFWKTAIPVMHSLKAKSTVDIIRWCESKGYIVTEKGYEHPTEPYYSFLFQMFPFCGKKLTPEARAFCWEEEWMEKIY